MTKATELHYRVYAYNPEDRMITGASAYEAETKFVKERKLHPLWTTRMETELIPEK